MRNFQISSITIILTLLSSAIISQTETCLENSNHPGHKLMEQVSNSETYTREYILRAPENYDDESATPLLINLHGFGNCAYSYLETVGDFFGLHELADQEQFLIAYPQGAFHDEKDDTYWIPGDNGIENIYENDIYYLEQLVIDVANDYNVDLDKVFAVGYSNGGMMTYSLACNSNHVFSAVGIMSGAMLEEDCLLEMSIPIINFHGIADEVLPYEGNEYYRSVSEIVDLWLDKNGIPADNLVSEELNNGKVTRDQYYGGNENSCFTLYTITEQFGLPGGHFWFSGEINGNKPDKIMWDFFNGNCSLLSNNENEIDMDFNLTISPNPFYSNITLESDLLKEAYSIYNAQGKKVFSGFLQSNDENLDLGHLPSHSIYFLRIGEHTKKLIKID